LRLMQTDLADALGFVEDVPDPLGLVDHSALPVLAGGSTIGLSASDAYGIAEADEDIALHNRRLRLIVRYRALSCVND
jgi:hypothetical protein